MIKERGIMITKKQGFLFSVLAILLLLCISACNSTAANGTQGPLQVLQNSFNAMKQLKAVHVNIQLATTIDMSGSSNPSSTSSTSHPLTVNVAANGDEVSPDKASIHLSMGQSFNLSEITLGKQIYIQNLQGQWYVLDASKFKDARGNPFSITNTANYNNLLAVAQKATYTDHGMQSLHGVSLRHITVTFGKDALKDLINASGSMSSLSGVDKQKLTTLLNDIKLEAATLDVWIDEATSYVHHMELKFTMDVHTSSLVPTPTSKSSSFTLPADIKTSVDTIIDYSKFNESITISPPANAIPTNNPTSIFGGSHF
jgi:hypothetical protein